MESLTKTVVTLVSSLVDEVGDDHAALGVEPGRPRGFGNEIHVEPRNPRSATIWIGVDDVSGLQVVLGHYCVWEGDHCAKPAERDKCVKFVESMCRAVMKGNFQEITWFARDKSGKKRVIATKGLVKLEDEELRFRSGLPGLPIPFLRTTKREFEYEPYL